MERHLKGVGEFDYDIRNDILLFKVKDREYSHSIELSTLVIDFDEEDFIVGLQIINASEILQISKDALRGVSGFRMKAKINNGVVQMNLTFDMTLRNKTTVMPIIFERVGEGVPDSKMMCVAR